MVGSCLGVWRAFSFFIVFPRPTLHSGQAESGIVWFYWLLLFSKSLRGGIRVGSDREKGIAKEPLWKKVPKDMFNGMMQLSPVVLGSVLMGVMLVLWIGVWMKREWKRRGEQAMLAHVVDHFIHDRVRNDLSHFERDRLYVSLHISCSSPFIFYAFHLLEV